MARLLFFLSVALIIGLLAARFPYRLNAGDNLFYLAYLGTLLALVGGAAFASRRLPLSRLLRDLGIWVAIFIALVALYAYRGVLEKSEIAAQLMPSRPVVSGDATVLKAGTDGHFHAEVEVNGVPLEFIIDTGASDIMLNPSDAAALGLPLESLEYERIYQTANGVTRGAPVMLDSVEIGTIRIDRMPASISQSEMGSSLLGMAFLRRLSLFRMEGDTLVMQP